MRGVEVECERRKLGGSRPRTSQRLRCACRSTSSGGGYGALARLSERLDEMMRDRHREAAPSARPDASPPSISAHLLARRTSGSPRAPPRRARLRSTAPRHGSRSSARRGTARAGSSDRRRGRPGSPTSSFTSRLTASSIVSPGSRNPASAEYMPGAKRGWRPSRQRSPSIASMITTGSTRGKISMLQVGQTRLPPPPFTVELSRSGRRSGWRCARRDTSAPAPARRGRPAPSRPRSRASGGR